MMKIQYVIVVWYVMYVQYVSLGFREIFISS